MQTNPSTSNATTATLRELARNARQAGDFSQAATLYTLAVARYPQVQGELAKRDIGALQSMAAECRRAAAVMEKIDAVEREVELALEGGAA